MKAITCIVVALGLWPQLPAAALAADEHVAVQEHAEILTTVQDFIQTSLEGQNPLRTEVEVQPPDSRLRLAACAQPLEAFLPNQSKLIGSTTIGVRCDSPKAWTLYVTAQIRVYDKIAVTAAPLKRGDALQGSDVQMVDYDVSQLDRGYYSSLDDLNGLILRRALSSGTPLTPSMLVAPKLVKRGETVTLVVDSASLQIRASGTALSDGHKGEQIRVRNERSKQIVEGIVTAAGTVEFPL